MLANKISNNSDIKLRVKGLPNTDLIPPLEENVLYIMDRYQGPGPTEGTYDIYYPFKDIRGGDITHMVFPHFLVDNNKPPTSNTNSDKYTFFYSDDLKFRFSMMATPVPDPALPPKPTSADQTYRNQVGKFTHYRVYSQLGGLAQLPDFGTPPFDAGVANFLETRAAILAMDKELKISISSITHASNVSFSEINGVTLTNPDEGHQLYYNNGTGQWENRDPSGEDMTFNTVNITGKLTVGGIIDPPTGLELSPQPVNPPGSTVPANVLWLNNADSDKLYRGAIAVEGGESNTASNVGVAGVGVFKQKTGVDLEFKKLNAGSNKVTVVDDVANDEVDINVVDSNLVIDYSQLTSVPTSFTPSQHTFDDNTVHSGVDGTGKNDRDVMIYEDLSGNWIPSRVAYSEVTGTPDLVTATNVGVAGVGVYKEQVSGEIRLKKINNASNKVSIADDVANDEVDIDVVPANINLSELGTKILDNLDDVVISNTFAEIYTPDLFFDPADITGTSGNGIIWPPAVGTVSDVNQAMPNATISTLGVQNAVQFGNTNEVWFRQVTSGSISGDMTFVVVYNFQSDPGNNARIISASDGSGVASRYNDNTLTGFNLNTGNPSTTAFLEWSPTFQNTGQDLRSLGSTAVVHVVRILAENRLRLYLNGSEIYTNTNFTGDRTLSHINLNGESVIGKRLGALGWWNSAQTPTQVANQASYLSAYFSAGTSGVQNRQSVIYNGSNWINDFPKITDNSDVVLSSLEQGAKLYYQLSSNSWRNYTSNQGQIKVNSFNTNLTSNAKPTFIGLTTEQLIEYHIPGETFTSLNASSFPTTSVPLNQDAGVYSDALFYTSNGGGGTDYFKQNQVLGQVSEYRIEVSYTNKTQANSGRIQVRLFNPLSGFSLESAIPLAQGITSDAAYVELITISDGANLSAPLGTGNGYRLGVSSTTSLDLVIDSITNISREYVPRN